MNESLDAATLAPGGFVRNPHCPEWGLGRIQSVVGTRVTVNFEEAGKVVVDLANAILETADPDQ